jgi:hypothetical protein
MKKIFALFCAVFLMPSFSAQAWIGGPFSNNAFFGETGADGVYEATASAVNGLGIYRIVVGNQFQGVGTAQLQNTGNNTSTVINGNGGGGGGGGGGTSVRPIDFTQIRSGNTVIGVFGSYWTNVWYYRGVSYRGRTLGTANFAAGTVMATGQAYSTEAVNSIGGTVPQDLTPNASINSSFRAQVRSSGKLIAARTFRGTGVAQVRFADRTQQGTATPRPQRFSFTVFGSKVSDSIFLGL